MIEANQLFPERSESLKITPMSMKKLGVARRKLVIIDDLLKDKLILSKMREGIRKQEEQKLKRQDRETELEDDRSDDIDDDGRKRRRRKKPKPDDGGGILGSILSPLLSAGLSGILTAAAPVVKLAMPILTFGLSKLFGGIVFFSQKFGVVSTALSKFGGLIGFKKLLLSSFGQKTIAIIAKLQTVFNTFLTTSIISGLVNAGSEVENVIQGGLGKKLRTEKQVTKQIQKKLNKEVLESTRLNLVTQERLRQNTISKKLIEQLELETTVKGKNKIIKRLKKVQNIEISSENLKNLNKMISGSMTAEQYDDLIIRGRTSKVFDAADISIAQRLGLSEDLMEFGKGKKVGMTSIKESSQNTLTELLSKSTKKIKPKDVVDARKLSDIFKIVIPEPMRMSDEVFDNIAAMLSGRISSDQLDDIIMAQRKGIDRADVFFDARNIFRNMKPQKVIKQRGIKGFLEFIGGNPLVKTTRKLFNNTLGKIPFIGDLLGLLVDIFIFKEPIGRAAFMAVGGGLGAFLGGLAGSALPGIGTFILGLLGGMAGDFLGGLFYDILFKRKTNLEGQTIKSTTKRTVITGVEKLAFSGGGSVPDVASFAPYDDPQQRVAVRTILIPLATSGDSDEGDAIIITKNKKNHAPINRSLYAGGLA